MHRCPFIKCMLFPPLALAKKTSSNVLSSKHFAGMMLQERVKEVLVSFNVTSLFTNVPIDKAVDVIHRKLAAEEDLVVRTPLLYQRRGQQSSFSSA